MEITISVSKKDVYNNVGLLSSYAGAKSDAEGSQYDFISTTDEDEQLLDRFWGYAKNKLCDVLRRLVVSENEISTIEGDTKFELELKVSDRFNTSLKSSIERNIRDYFVKIITTYWYMYTNKTACEAVSAEVQGLLDEIYNKVYSLKRPVRPQ